MLRQFIINGQEAMIIHAVLIASECRLKGLDNQLQLRTRRKLTCSLLKYL